MTKIKEYFKKHKYVWLLSYWPVHGLWYLILQSVTMNRDPIAVVSKLDYLIPFCEWMIIPYVLWYIQLAGTLLYLVIKEPKSFVRASLFIMGGCFVCMLICTVFPMYFDRTGMPMYQNDNLLTTFVKALQGFDAPTTVLPSMHVYVSCACSISLCKVEPFRKNKLFVASSVLLSTVISASTVLIKQHSIIDVLTALLLVFVMYFVAYFPKYKRLMMLVK